MTNYPMVPWPSPLQAYTKNCSSQDSYHVQRSTCGFETAAVGHWLRTLLLGLESWVRVLSLPLFFFIYLQQSEIVFVAPYLHHCMFGIDSHYNSSHKNGDVEVFHYGFHVYFPGLSEMHPFTCLGPSAYLLWYLWGLFPLKNVCYFIMAFFQSSLYILDMLFAGYRL